MKRKLELVAEAILVIIPDGIDQTRGNEVNMVEVAKKIALPDSIKSATEMFISLLFDPQLNDESQAEYNIVWYLFENKNVN